jgi:O-antigen ligase
MREKQCKSYNLRNIIIYIILFIMPLWTFISPSTSYIPFILISLTSISYGFVFSKNIIIPFLLNKYLDFIKIKSSSQSKFRKIISFFNNLSLLDLVIIFIVLSFLLIPFSIDIVLSLRKWFGFVTVCTLGLQWFYFFNNQKENVKNLYIKSLSYGALIIILIILFNMVSDGYVEKQINEHLFDKERSHAKLFISSGIFLFMTMISLWSSSKIIRTLSPLFLTAFMYIDCDSLVVGMILGVILASFYKANIKIKKLISATLFIGTFLSPVIAFFAFSDSIIPEVNKYSKDISIIHRLSIWNESSKLILKKPFFGYGFKSTAKLGNEHKNIEFFNERNKFECISVSKIGSHAHNYALQFWIEFGILGALLASLFVYKISLKSLTFNLQSIFAFSLAFSVFAFSIGVFQTWWIATIWILLPFWSNQKQSY